MPEYELITFDGPEAFADRAYPFLEREEAANNIFFGVNGDCLEFPRRYPGDNFFGAIEEHGEVVAALLQTPPHNLILSTCRSPEVLEFAGDVFAGMDRDLPGVLGRPQSAEPFLRALRDAGGAGMDMKMPQRIYQAESADAPTGVYGCYRSASRDDTEILTDWIVEFEAEALGRERDGLRRDVANRVGEFVRSDSVAIWEVDGDCVSMAVARGPTPSGIRISYVYTPAEHRRNGYASACVAELTRRQISAGRDFCFLFTDLENPTSNHIYQDIGYEPVCDMNVYKPAESPVNTH